MCVLSSCSEIQLRSISSEFSSEREKKKKRENDRQVKKRRASALPRQSNRDRVHIVLSQLSSVVDASFDFSNREAIGPSTNEMSSASPRTSTDREDDTFAGNGVRAATVHVEASRRSFCPYDALPAARRYQPHHRITAPPPPSPSPSPPRQKRRDTSTEIARARECLFWFSLSVLVHPRSHRLSISLSLSSPEPPSSSSTLRSRRLSLFILP